MKDWPALKWASAVVSMILGTAFVAPAFGIAGLWSPLLGIALGCMTLVGLHFVAKVEPPDTSETKRQRVKGLLAVGVLMGVAASLSLGAGTSLAVTGGIMCSVASLLNLGVAVYEDYQLSKGKRGPERVA